MGGAVAPWNWPAALQYVGEDRHAACWYHLTARVKDHKFKLRNTALYEDTQGWVRVLHECKFEQQFSAFHEMFMQWLEKMQEFEWKGWWEKYWANKRFSLCHLKYLHVSANNNCERSFRTLKADLGNVQLGFVPSRC